MRLDAASEAALRAHIDAGMLAEHHYLEVKREIPAGSGANIELARDLASFAIDGGTLVIGVAEDKTTNTYSPAPVHLPGLAERVEQVAASRIAPRLNVRCREIQSDSGAEVGYLIIEVPPSPEAPHMVDGRYYGRGDTTKHVLADADVRRLNERRLGRRARFLDQLAAEVERDPTPPHARSEAHLFVLASPSTGRPEMLHDALSAAGQTLRSWAQTAILRGPPGSRLAWPPHADFDPNIDDRLDVATRANGVGLHTWEVGPNRVPRSGGDKPVRERRLLDLEIDDDGTVRLFCSAGTITRSVEGDLPHRLMLTPLVAGLLVRIVRCAVEVSNTIPYTGSWDIGLQLTNSRGAASSRRAQNFSVTPIEYTEDGYEASAQFLVDELGADERAVVTRLCGRLYRGLGEDLGAW